MRKGIVLAGGKGTRLFPLTINLNKHLIPIYDKPMIFYPIATLMLAGIQEIAIISDNKSLVDIKNVLVAYEKFNIRFTYFTQNEPNGIAEAFTIAEDFINDKVALILGDNVFHGAIDFLRIALEQQTANNDNIIFAYPVKKPERFGVLDFDKTTGLVNKIVEKPKEYISNYAIPGLYLLDKSACEKAKVIKPSLRGELEITDVLELYRKENNLKAIPISRGVAWLDTGVPEDLLHASHYFYTLESRQGYKSACLEEIALRKGFISIEEFNQIIFDYPNCEYKSYLEMVATEF